MPQRFADWVRTIWESIFYFPGKYYPDLVPNDPPNSTSWLAYSNTNWSQSSHSNND